MLLIAIHTQRAHAIRLLFMVVENVGDLLHKLTALHSQHEAKHASSSMAHALKLSKNPRNLVVAEKL